MNEQNLVANKEDKFNATSIAMFLCKYFNVSDISKIQPYGTNCIPAYHLARDTHLAVKCCFNDTLHGGGTPYLTTITPLRTMQPKDPFVHPVTKSTCTHDLNNAMIVNANTRHCKFLCDKKVNIQVRLNFDHEPWAKLQGTDEHDKLTEDAGGVKRAFLMISPTGSEGKDLTNVPLVELNFGYTNSEFTRTMALINETNLRNGIIEIPNQVCVDAGLNVFGRRKLPELSDQELEKMISGMNLENKEEEKQRIRQQDLQAKYDQFKDVPKIQTFFAVPHNHIIAWGYQSREYAQQHNHNFEVFVCNYFKYFLIPDIYFHATFKSILEFWVGKVDKRPITSVGFELIPDLPKGESVKASIELQSYFHYWTVPSGLSSDNINKLAPMLSPEFLPCDNWSMDEVTKMLREARQEEEENKMHNKIKKK